MRLKQFRRNCSPDRGSAVPRFRGFSFIETVIALALVGGTLVAGSALLRGVPLMQVARDQDFALRIAASKIEELRGGGYAALPPSGSFSHALLGTLASSSAMLTVSAVNDETKRIDVSVSWVAKNAGSRTVSLITLITEHGGL